MTTAERPSEPAVRKVSVEDRRRLRQVVRDVTLFRVVFLAMGWLSVWMLVPDNVRPDFDLDLWHRWDAIHYTAIAQWGYADFVAQGNGPGFLPGYPIAIRVVAWIPGVGALVAAMALAFVGTIAAAFFLHKLAEHDGHSGDRAVLAMLLFPSAVFLVAPYSEALFLAVAIPAFYFARTQRPWYAVPLVFAACLLRPVGPFLAFGVMVQVMQGRWSLAGLRSRLAVLVAMGVAAVAPLAAHGIYLRERTGTYFSYFEAQERISSRGFANPVDAFLTTADWDRTGVPASYLVAQQLEVLFVGLGLGVLVWLGLRREWGYAAYVGSTLASVMFSEFYLSVPRLSLSLFPFLFVIADLADRPGWRERLFPVMGCLSMLGVVIFTQHLYFV
ncbi:mannosyltransferase family protein [Actinospongicola halichondriae]|uniref:mannosyltransferase family protein n=1 Tax=Actinospongicola halichondriae TaxID=3236844 RepID=UPI003D4CA6F6